MIHSTMNAKGLFEFSPRMKTPVTFKRCSLINTYFVSDNKVANNVA